MLENATNLTAQLEVESIGNIILSKLIAFFSEPYAEKVLLAILIIVTLVSIEVTKMVHKRSDFYNRFQQVYDDLLTPGKVKLSYDEKGLRYTQQEHPEWEGFISEVNKRIKRKPWKYKARGLYEKVKKAVDDYEGYDQSVHREIASTFIDRLNKEELDFTNWDGKGKEPSEDFIIPQAVPSSIDYIIRGIKSLTVQKENRKESERGRVITAGTGRCILLCHGVIAKTDSESKINPLKDVIQSMANAEEVKELIAKRDKMKNDMEQKRDMYNNKLAKVIQDLRFCRW